MYFGDVQLAIHIYVLANILNNPVDCIKIWSQVDYKEKDFKNSYIEISKFEKLLLYHWPALFRLLWNFSHSLLKDLGITPLTYKKYIYITTGNMVICIPYYHITGIPYYWVYTILLVTGDMVYSILTVKVSKIFVTNL